MVSPVRRTTIVVGDIERSLAFYREALGLKVFYDQEIAAEATGRLLEVPGARVRLVSLQGEDSVAGMVGLMAFRSHPIRPRQRIGELGLRWDSVLLFVADDLDVGTVFGRVSTAGAPIVSPLMQYDIPQRGRATGFACQDPDGVLVVVMRFGPFQPEGKTAAVGPIHRTTIVVDDIEQSLSFYRDILGLSVYDDRLIASEEATLLLGVPGARARIVSLQSQGSVHGMLGLMAFDAPPPNPRRLNRQHVGEPGILLVFLTGRITALRDQLEQNGVRIKCPPIEYEIPDRGICAGMTCYDPSGVVVEFTQFSSTS